MSNSSVKQFAWVLGIFLAVVCFGLIKNRGLAPQEPSVQREPSRYEIIDDGKSHLLSQLKDPYSARFGEMWVGKIKSEKGEEAPVACGYVNAKNSFGGYTGYKRFLANGGMSIAEDSGTNSVFESMWKDFCEPLRTAGL